MARKITLFDSTDEKLLNFNNCRIDVVRDYTIIFNKPGFSDVYLPLKVQCFNIQDCIITVNYISGHYLTILR
jgi:hypothetical protein